MVPDQTESSLHDHDFDQEELQMFLEKCTEAISVNAAEQERFQSEYNELAMKDAGLERYFENAEGLDIPSAMAAYRLSRVQMDINANLMGAKRWKMFYTQIFSSSIIRKSFLSYYLKFLPQIR